MSRLPVKLRLARPAPACASRTAKGMHELHEYGLYAKPLAGVIMSGRQGVSRADSSARNR
jgi:hypothetical protein